MRRRSGGQRRRARQRSVTGRCMPSNSRARLTPPRRRERDKALHGVNRQRRLKLDALVPLAPQSLDRLAHRALARRARAAEPVLREEAKAELVLGPEGRHVSVRERNEVLCCGEGRGGVELDAHHEFDVGDAATHGAHGRHDGREARVEVPAASGRDAAGAGLDRVAAAEVGGDAERATAAGG